MDNTPTRVALAFVSVLGGLILLKYTTHFFTNDSRVHSAPFERTTARPKAARRRRRHPETVQVHFPESHFEVEETNERLVSPPPELAPSPVLTGESDEGSLDRYIDRDEDAVQSVDEPWTDSWSALPGKEIELMKESENLIGLLHAITLDQARKGCFIK
jgi:hypothetical protein